MKVNEKSKWRKETVLFSFAYLASDARPMTTSLYNPDSVPQKTSFGCCGLSRHLISVENTTSVLSSCLRNDSFRATFADNHNRNSSRQKKWKEENYKPWQKKPSRQRHCFSSPPGSCHPPWPPSQPLRARRAVEVPGPWAGRWRFCSSSRWGRCRAPGTASLQASQSTKAAGVGRVTCRSRAFHPSEREII